MPTALYCRISRDDLGDGLGVHRQEQDCRALAARHGSSQVTVYVDNDVSAFSGRVRPAYQRLLEDIVSGHVTAVLAWAPERLHRSPRELEDFLELIERTGTTVETVKAGAWDVSTSHGRLVARMLGAVSRAESERTGERVSRAHQQAKTRGLWRGPIPFGLRAGETPGMPVVHEPEAVVVKDIFVRVLRGDALTRIAADLNDAGIKPRRGERWTHTGALRLVSSPAIGGMIEVDGELHDAAFDGVVAAETWRDAHAALLRRPRGESRRPREKLTLLGGIMTCDDHGFTCFGSSAAHAATYAATGAGCCNVSITRAAADAFVTELLLRRLERPDARDLFSPEPVPSQAAAEAGELRRRRDEIAGLLADGLLSGSAARPRLEAIAERLGSLDAERRPRRTDEALFTSPRATWATWTQPQRREVLRLVLAKISLRHVGPASGPRADPTRMRIEWATR